VLDEPTSGLDPLVQHVFAQIVQERIGEGAAVLLSSHVMSEVEQIASRVALLREGRVAVVDDIEAIRARARRRGRIRPQASADLPAIAAAIEGVPGITDVVTDHDTVGFACSGDMDALVKQLAVFSIAALDVAHADLEDAFFG
jgi:ABC-2 type transport system ATP-binding protein